ncbi:MAG: AbrB/MazE/SpoVT family DNA-binding domain-containing protein [Clostridia bacterium]|nr:AbrB/MazE/SpoVT family DNA-binding domain-containing protein [Clostridia bacterium]
MIATKVFKNGNSQAIRLPQEMRTNKKELYITKLGNVYVAFPADDPWMPTKQAIGSFSEAFMEERNQPSWDAVLREEL